MTEPAPDPPPRLTVTADDTTGALESAARAADAGRSSVVVPYGLRADALPVDAAGCVVIDLRSRHELAAVAAARFDAAMAARRGDARVRVHKIDSTLRGNWPAEVRAAIHAGRRVLMVPAYPSAGRVCRGGVVLEHGIPVDLTAHARDVRSPVVTSRPAQVVGADELADVPAIARWLAGSSQVGVADAGDDAELDAVVAQVLHDDDVLLIGTAGVVGSVARQLSGPAQRTESAPAMTVAAPVLVVRGSLHPISRQQIVELVARGARHIGSPDTETAAVVVLEPPATPDPDPAAVAGAIARRAHQLIGSMAARTVVLIGGDTAEAFIADRVVRVDRSLDVGVALGSIDVDGRRLTLMAKPGAFGSRRTLVDLMQTVLRGSSR